MGSVGLEEPPAWIYPAALRQEVSGRPEMSVFCGPDKSLLAIKTAAYCKQQKLTKNYQHTESLFPSSPMRLNILQGSPAIPFPSWAVN